MGLAEHIELERISRIVVSFNLPGRFGFGRTITGNSPWHGLPLRFQSARQIWVWPNQRGARRPRLQDRDVSICQADLGLAELFKHFLMVGLYSLFQSARQIWVWPNELENLNNSIDPYRFNLPGRFGFGRTFRRLNGINFCTLFQSARQIWVWPNGCSDLTKIRSRFVSICQADLGLAEPVSATCR